MNFASLPARSLAYALLSSSILGFVCLRASAQSESASKPTSRPVPTATGKAGGDSIPGVVRELPVRQVVLYKNGVGYFEHLGSVSGNQRVSIDFTSSQLNDVLQSLTVLDEGGGHIAGVNYNSTTPLAEQLKSLSLAMSDDPTSTELFQALRGQRVEVTGATGGPITGRLMSIESRESQGVVSKADSSEDSGESAKSSSGTTSRYYLTVIANTGAVRVIELTPALSVRPLDASLQGQLDRYLELLSTTRTTGLRHLTLDALGQGQRQLRVSYISEVPVWKSTYRLVFPRTADGNAILQGWAVVDNTIGADWDNVQLSLVAGAPQSFIQPLSQPLYLRRPEIPISTTGMTTPQTHEAAEMNELSAPPPSPRMVADASAELAGKADRLMGGLSVAQPPMAVAPGAVGLSAGGGRGYGYGRGVGGGVFGGAGGGGVDRASDAFRTGDVSTNAFDDFFQYTLAQPVTIHKNESAMVPILQETLPAERVTLWSARESTPFRAVWLENTSKLTFDSGSFSVFESGSFAGEGLLDPIHPGEKRLISYAADLAIHIREGKNEFKSELREVTVGTYRGRHGYVRKRYAAQARRNWIASNSADEARTVVMEIPRQGNRELSPESKATESTPSLYRFKVAVPAHQSANLLVADEGYDTQGWSIEADQDQTQELRVLATESPSLAGQLEPVIAAQLAIGEMKEQLQQLGEKVTSLTADEARARDNLTALKGNDAAKRFVDELNRAEDGLETTRKQIADLTEKKKAAVEALRLSLIGIDLHWSSGGERQP